MARDNTRARREAFYVQVIVDEEQVQFFDATAYVGRKMPYTEPRAICALRVTDETVAFSLTVPTKTTRAKIASDPIVLPRGPLARVERRSLEIVNGTATVPAIGEGQIAVEINDTLHMFNASRDDAGVLSLDAVGEDLGVELPRQAMRVGVYMRSPIVDRVIGVFFIGHVGKPGASDTITRIAAKVLRMLSGLGDFQVLGNLTSVSVPAAPRGAVQPVRRENAKAKIVLPVQLFDGVSPGLTAAGVVTVEVDMDTPDQTSPKLLVHVTAAPKLAEVFVPFASQVRKAVLEFLEHRLGEPEVARLRAMVSINGIEVADVQQLREVLALMPAIDVMPHAYRPTALAVEPPPADVPAAVAPAEVVAVKAARAPRAAAVAAPAEAEATDLA